MRILFEVWLPEDVISHSSARQRAIFPVDVEGDPSIRIIACCRFDGHYGLSGSWIDEQRRFRMLAETDSDTLRSVFPSARVRGSYGEVIMSEADLIMALMAVETV